jgi:hypothetical protein
MMASIAWRAGGEAYSQARVQAAVGLEAAQGVAAAVAGDAAVAAGLLGAAMPLLHEAGGSPAQRALFAAMSADAVARARRDVMRRG